MSQAASEQVPDGTQDAPTEEVIDQGQSSETGTINVNPAWNDVLSLIPETMHPAILPKFQSWDQNYKTSIDKVHSQYEPWKPFIDNGVSPEDVDYSLGLLKAISENPQEVINALNEWVAAEQGNGNPEGVQPEQQGQINQNPQSPEFDISQHPAYLELQAQVKNIGQLLLSQHEKEQQAKQDSELQTELSSLQEKFKERGPFDEQYVLGVAMNDPETNLEKAAEKFYEMRDNLLRQQRQPGPPVLGAGGALPSSNVDTRKLDSAQTKQTVAQILAQAQQNQ